MRSDPWSNFNRDLEWYKQRLEALKYDPFQAAPPDFGPLRPKGALTLEDVQFLLLGPTAIGPPHGFELFQPVPIPVFPSFPASRPDPRPPDAPKDTSFWRWLIGSQPDNRRPTEPRPPSGPSPDFIDRTIKTAEDLGHRGQNLQRQFEGQFQTATARLKKLREACEANDPSAVRVLMSISHVQHAIPEPLRRSFETDFDLAARVALCTIEIPDFASLNIVKKRKHGRSLDWAPVSATERKRATETTLYSLCLRAAYLVAMSDEGRWFDTIAVNATQSWFDAATGAPRTGIIASLQANKDEIRQLRLEQVDPKTCFRHLKGISTPSIERVSAIRPIFILNKDDSRIIKDRDVDKDLEPQANLAAMPWDDFEHLVRQLFEWEFEKHGAEVKVTRASRDRGVDAIVFDPDPLRGGKYVLQAKRYTRPVDVAAVRDLYGTVVNEGANRGILVTTSSYGPDAYDFAKDKPLSLIDGPNLLAMLKKHGRLYRIDLIEARRLATLDEPGSV
jgi:restriction system protein